MKIRKHNVKKKILMEGVNFIKNFRNIPVYSDPHMSKDNFLVMYKGAEIENPGYVWVPNEVWNEGLKTAKGAVFEKSEVDEILRQKRDHKLSDVKAIICNCPEEDIEKIINTLYIKFK